MEQKIINHVTLKKNGTDLDQNKSKCSEFLNTILNLQEETRSKIDVENYKKTKTNYNSNFNRQVNKTNKSIPKNTVSLNKLNKNRTNPINSKSHSNYKSITTKGSVAIKPILKPTKSMELANLNRVKTPIQNRSSKSNFLLKKSKSAENLLRQRSSSNHSIRSFSPKANYLKKNSLTNLNDREYSDTKRFHKSLDNLNKTFESLNDLNYFKLLELFLTKKQVAKSESKNYFLKNLFNFLQSTTKEKTENKNHHEELESKLEYMKIEIDQLKKNINSSSSNSTKSGALIENMAPSTAKIQHQQQTNFKVDNLDDDTNLFNTNYSEKIFLMQKQINDLKELNKSLIIENEIKRKNQVTLSSNFRKVNELNTNKESIFIEKLQKELRDSREKSKMLENMLEEKTKQVETYGKLFKEISENVNTLVKDLENKEGIFVSQISSDGRNNKVNDSTNETISLSSLKENLAFFQSKLQNHQIKNDSRKTNSNNILRNQIKKRLNITNANDISKDNSATTTSDTLIDADSSFYSLKIDPLRQKNFFPANFTSKNFKFNVESECEFESNSSTYTQSDKKMPNILNEQRNQNQLKLEEKFNLNNLKLRQHKINLQIDAENEIDDINEVIVDNQINHDEDDDEENEKIIIAMEDLSISTMQTSNNATSDSFDNSAYTFKSEDDDHFQENLKKLDEKIFNVKQMLESMKSN